MPRLTPSISTCGLLLMLGCVPKQVYVELPAAPAVHLPSASVAIISADRGCQRLSNQFAKQMTREALFRVSPKAEVRLLVSNCQQQIRPIVDIKHRVDARSGTVQEKRRLHLEGQGFAQVEVQTSTGSQAHLLAQASWRQEASGSRAVRGLRQLLLRQLANDLLEQVRPIPHVAQRRVFPNAQPNSHRAMLTRAVAAEINGDLRRAIALASAANEQSPNPRIHAYLSELIQRADRGGDSHDKNPSWEDRPQ
jgi:hypothetical protein